MINNSKLFLEGALGYSVIFEIRFLVLVTAAVFFVLFFNIRFSVFFFECVRSRDP